METTFTNVCNILSELYSNYKEDEDFQGLIEFNDIGLPLAYFAAQGLCDLSDDGKHYVKETWKLFLDFLDLEDAGFVDLAEVLASNKKE